MATKVYLDPTGKLVIVDNGNTINPIKVSDFFFDRDDSSETVFFRDKSDDYKYASLASEVQDEFGTPVGTYQDVLDLLTSLVDDNVTSEIKRKKTPTSILTTTSHDIPVGASEVSVFNNGTTDATVNGVKCPAGVTRTFGFKNEIDTQIVCTASATSELIIDYMM